jgi:hypothetical protein
MQPELADYTSFRAKAVMLQRDAADDLTKLLGLCN